MSIVQPELSFYEGDSPKYLEKARMCKAMLRLQGVGMHCGLEYTSLPYFADVEPYSRYSHSLGVAQIVLHFGGSKKEVLAGLFHDIATPTFSHVIDFLQGDAVNQESTEAPTQSLIAHDKEIQAFLKNEGLSTGDVADYHLYPLCDNPSPHLSADRLEYTLSNFLHFHFCSKEKATQFYSDLELGTNEKGEPEIVFRHEETASAFAHLALQNSLMYSRAEDRYAMGLLSKTLSLYLDQGILSQDGFMLTEEQLIHKIEERGSLLPWKTFRGLYLVEAGEPDKEHEGFLYREVIDTKKRYIDPYIKGKGRVSQLDPEFASLLNYFLSTPFDVPLCGYSRLKKK